MRLLFQWLCACLQALEVVLAQGPCSWSEWQVLTGSACLQLRPQRTVTHPMCSLLGGGADTVSPQARTPWGQRTEAERLCLQPQGPCVGGAPAWLLRACHLLKMLNIFEQEFSNFHFSLSPANCVAGGGWTGHASRLGVTQLVLLPEPGSPPRALPCTFCPEHSCAWRWTWREAQVSCHRRGAGARGRRTDALQPLLVRQRPSAAVTRDQP